MDAKAAALDFARVFGKWSIAQPTPVLNLTTMKKFKRIFVALIGGTVLAIGVALIVLPGPAFLVIPAGLAILAIEFAWAKRWLHKARGWLPGRHAPQPGSAQCAAEPEHLANKETASQQNRASPDSSRSP